MTPRIDHIRAEQAAQRGLIAKFATYYAACFLGGWIVAQAVTTLVHTTGGASW